jgi:hypothetical protein
VVGVTPRNPKGVIVSRQVKSALAVLVVLLLLIVAGILWLSTGVDQSPSQTQNIESPSAPASKPAPAAVPIPAEPIKVGLILSHQMSITSLLADGQTKQKTPAPWGYKHMAAISKELKSPMIELIPVIEPGTESDPPLAQILQKQFRGETPVDGHDPKELGELNVLVASQVWMSTPEMIAATHEAVSNGLSLLIRQSFGDWRPGYTPEVLALHGLKEGAYARTTPWNNPVPAEIVGEHPILGTLSGKQSTELTDVLPTGAYGVLTDNAVPLMRLKYLERIVPDSALQSHPDWSFYTLYTAHLGRGRIICCNFDVSNQPPKNLSSATRGAFTLHCVEWLAAEQKAATSQPATTQPENKLEQGSRN